MEVEGWSQLEELSIAGEAATELVGEYRLGDEALSRLVRGATRLKLLDLRGLQRLTDSGLVRVPAWDLQHLFLGGECVVLLAGVLPASKVTYVLVQDIIYIHTQFGAAVNYFSKKYFERFSLFYSSDHPRQLEKSTCKIIKNYPCGVNKIN